MKYKSNSLVLAVIALAFCVLSAASISRAEEVIFQDDFDSYGTLSVRTRPWSKVYIDGKFIKNTPLIKHRLKAGTYRITVENVAYRIKKNFRTTIRAGELTTLAQDLL